MKQHLRNPSYLLSSTCTWECEEYLSDLNRYSYTAHTHGCNFCLGLKKSYSTPSFGEIDCRKKHKFIDHNERMDDLKQETYRLSEEAKNRSRSYEGYARDVVEDQERTDSNLDYIRSSNANKRSTSDKTKELNASDYATCCSSESISSAQTYHCFFCSHALSSQSSFSQHMLTCLQNKARQSQNMRKEADQKDIHCETNKISRFKSPKETSPQAVAKKKFKHRRTFHYEKIIASSDVEDLKKESYRPSEESKDRSRSYKSYAIDVIEDKERTDSNLLRSTQENSDSSTGKVKGLDFSCTKTTQFGHKNETVPTRNQGYPSHSRTMVERDSYDDDGTTKEKVCKYNGETWSTNRNIFSCMLCHERFSTEFALHQHLRSHSGKKTFQCRFCQKAFAHQTSLIGHESQHWQQQLHYSLDQET